MPNLPWHGPSIYNCNHRGPLTIIPVDLCLAVELLLPDFKSEATGGPTPDFPLARQTLYRSNGLEGFWHLFYLKQEVWCTYCIAFIILRKDVLLKLIYLYNIYIYELYFTIRVKHKIQCMLFSFISKIWNQDIGQSLHIDNHSVKLFLQF